MTSIVESQVLKHFEISKRLGKGAYGIVWKVISKETSDAFALKKIFDAFCNKTDAQRTYREIFFLRELGNHPNIVRLHGIFKAQNKKDIYLVFEYMETDLHKVIKRGGILHPIHKQFIMFQLLKAVNYLHSAEVIHRDLKPSNVLIDSACRVKLCDFGLARSLATLRKQTLQSSDELPREGVSEAAPLTEYVATRWYRAPEILLASGYYTKGVDLWSLGCILGEMLLGKPLFPGASTLDQLELIISTMPHPLSQQDTMCIKGPYSFRILSQASLKCRKPITMMLPTSADRNGVDLMSRLLQFDPLKRATICEALDHIYVRRFRSAKEQLMTMPKPLQPPIDDNVQLSIREYRKYLYQMAAKQKTKARSNEQRNEFLFYNGKCPSKATPVSQYPSSHRKLAIPIKTITMSNQAIVEVDVDEGPSNFVSANPVHDSGPTSTNQRSSSVNVRHAASLDDASIHLNRMLIRNQIRNSTNHTPRLGSCSVGRTAWNGKTGHEGQNHRITTSAQFSFPRIHQLLGGGALNDNNSYIKPSVHPRVTRMVTVMSPSRGSRVSSVPDRTRGRLITPSLTVPDTPLFPIVPRRQKATWKRPAVVRSWRRLEGSGASSNVACEASCRPLLMPTAPLRQRTFQTINNSSLWHLAKL